MPQQFDCSGVVLPLQQDVPYDWLYAVESKAVRVANDARAIRTSFMLIPSFESDVLRDRRVSI